MLSPSRHSYSSSLPYYSPLAVDKPPLAATVCRIAGIRFFTMVLVRLIYAEELVFAEFRCYDPWIAKVVAEYLSHFFHVRSLSYHYSSASFFVAALVALHSSIGSL